MERETAEGPGAQACRLAEAADKGVSRRTIHHPLRQPELPPTARASGVEGRHAVPSSGA